MARCVCFDLGGVVLRINHSWADAAFTAGVTLGRPEHSGGLNDFAGIHAFQKEELSYPAYQSQLAEYLGVTPDEARRVHEGILIGPYDGAEELVADINSAGLTSGVLSNTNRPHIAYCQATFAVCRLFDFFGTSYDAHANKPDPAIFHWFQAQVGLEPSEIIFFDDGLANVEGAQAVGWSSHLIDPHGNPPAYIRAVLMGEGWL